MWWFFGLLKFFHIAFFHLLNKQLNKNRSSSPHKPQQCLTILHSKWLLYCERVHLHIVIVVFFGKQRRHDKLNSVFYFWISVALDFVSSREYKIYLSIVKWSKSSSNWKELECFVQMYWKLFPLYLCAR